MLTERTAAEKAATWAGSVIDVPADRRHSYPQGTKTRPLPDVACTCTGTAIVKGDEIADELAIAAIEQVWLRTFAIDGEIMIQVGDDEADAEAKDAELDAWGAALAESLIADASLDGALDANGGEFRLRTFETEKTPPFVQYDDSTTGRVLGFELRLATVIDEPE